MSADDVERLHLPKRRRVVSSSDDDEAVVQIEMIELSDGQEIMTSYKSEAFEQNKENIKAMYEEFCASKLKCPESERKNAAEVKMTSTQM